MKARRLPADDAGCGWWNILPPSGAASPLRGDLRVATAIVGAGFTGLAAARRLAELAPGAEVALIDAQRAGYGAAGRSSGFVVDLAGFIAALAPPDADRFIHLSRRAISLLRDAVETHAIDCCWDDTGWLHVAATEAGEASLAGLRSWLDGRGEAYDFHGAAGLRDILGTAYYRSGLRLPGSVLVQPAALIRGLATALPETVHLYEGTPALRLHPGRPAVIDTPEGRITADRVLVGTNGLMPTLGLLRQRVFPLWTFGSLTRRMTEAEQAELGGESEWGVLAQDPLGSSLRRTRDQRLLVRNSVHFSRKTRVPDRLLAEAVDEQRKALTLRFPRLADLPFEHSWSGVMGMSANGHSHFGPVGENLWAAAGYNAAGIALGTISGHLLADAALGHRCEDLEAMEALPDPSWFPPSPFSDLGIRWRVRRMEAATKGEV